MTLFARSPGVIAWALAAGLALGLFYFWGLWWTSKRIVSMRAPGFFALGSFVIRLAVVVFGIYATTEGRPIETVVALAGLLIGRRLVVGRVQSGKGD